MLIDAHFHLDLMDNMQSLIQEFRSARIGVICVGTTPKAYEKEVQLCSNTSAMKVGLGMHPQLVADREQETDLFLRLVKASKFIGEIGLDFNSAFLSSKDQQISCFRKIAKSCAAEKGKIISVHSVKAAGTVIDELNAANVFRDNICIFHWFTGSIVECKRAVEAGAYFSINPKMLNTIRGQETIRAIPANRILLETDAPFSLKISSAKQLETELEILVGGISRIRGEDMEGRIEKNSERILL